MSTLNFEIGSLDLQDKQLVIENKTLYNTAVIGAELILIPLGLYLLLGYPSELVSNFFELGIVKVAAVISLWSGFVIASSLHLEKLTIDPEQQEIRILERRWFGLIPQRSQYRFDRSSHLIVKGWESEGSVLYTLWLDLGEENKICLGRTSEQRVTEVVQAISTALELDETRVKRLEPA